MAKTTLTAEQNARLAEMPADDRQDWANYYADRNEREAEARREAEAKVRAMVAERGSVDPAEARKVTGLPAVEFNAVVRLLKFTGGYAIDDAGLLVSA